MLSVPKYLAVAVVASLGMAGIYIYTQVLGIVENLDLWFTVIPWYNAVLFAVFAALFGITLAFQVRVWTGPKSCSLGSKGSVGVSSGGTFAVFLVAQCPACASIGALFLPLSAMAFLTSFSWLINLVGIGLLMFTINYLGGFRK